MDAERAGSQTHVIIGAAMEVHRQPGPGFMEAAYQEALAMEMAACGIRFQREADLTVRYKGKPLRCMCKADFICFEFFIVELKALAALGGLEQAQVINDLKATGLRRGLLLNFGTSRLHVKRLIYDAHLCSSVKSADNGNG
jgi:GxxExxY protein